MAIHQVLASAAPHERLTARALADRDVLRRLGPSEVFAPAVHPDLRHAVHLLGDYDDAAGGQDALLLVHVATGAPEVVRFLEGRGERAGLVYHGIPPAAAFAPFDPHHATLLELGRRELPTLVARSAFALAPSTSAAGELATLGPAPVVVVPPRSELDGRPRPAAAAPFADPDGPVVLAVADLAPHHGLHRLVDAFHVLATYLRLDASLVLAGPATSPRYARLVERHADRLVLLPVSWPGALSAGALAACYRRADVFVTLSEYEPFCLPAVDAMAFDLPVVARRTPGLADTTAGAAILVDDLSPTLVAEAICVVLDDADLRAELVARGRRRVVQHRRESDEAAYLDAIGRFV